MHYGSWSCIFEGCTRGNVPSATCGASDPHPATHEPCFRLPETLRLDETGIF